ncbi:MAG: hypothetical protein KAH57_05350 [Thermoplasmata archaeon]|nr:hypothetical protein [Thermoplasmata archaeon]
MRSGSSVGGRGSKRALPLLLIPLLLLASLPAHGVDPQDPATRDQYYKRVQIDEGSTFVLSGGISQWESLNVGIIGRSSTIVTKLRNQMDIPFREIEVNLTIYWYDGPQPDKGQIMHKDFRMVDIKGGDGILSEEIQFEWTPQFAGSYAINLSCYVPGDILPITDTWSDGLGRYILTQSTNFHHGWWVGTQAWNCSSLEGWNISTQGGPADQGWHISQNPLALADGDIHTSPDVLYVGNDTSGMAPTSGVYTLTSPPINLSRFNPDAYMHEWRTSRPQIYLLYKYRGHIYGSGPNGKGGLFHKISIVGEDDFKTLKDNKYTDLDPWNHTVILNGNTSDLPGEPLWAEPNHPSYHGDTTIPGIELGEYVGKNIQIRIEYIPSGLEETGFMIDDIIIIGKEMVDITPFEIDVDDQEHPSVNPGSSVEFLMNLTLRPSLDATNIRIECFDSIDFIDIDMDVTIDPREVIGGGQEKVVVPIAISVEVPRGSPNGEAWFDVRVLGGGVTRDVRLHFWINGVHSTDSMLEEIVDRLVDPGTSLGSSITLVNRGNVVERFDHTFISNDGLHCENGRGRTMVNAGESASLNCTIQVPEGSMAGGKKGYFVISTSPLPSDDEILLKITQSDPDPIWRVHVIDLMVRQLHSIELAVPSSYRSIEDPPENGGTMVAYDVFITNMGNGDETVLIQHEGLEYIPGIQVIHPEQAVIGPGSTEVISIELSIAFPIPEGRYAFHLSINSTTEDLIGNWTEELIISIGDAPVPPGLYMINGSISSEPDQPLLGEEGIISFSVRSFGLQSYMQFSAVIMLNGVEVITKDLTTLSSSETRFQIPMTYNVVGRNDVTIRIFGENVSSYRDPDLKSSFHFLLNVSFVELTLTNLTVGGIGPLDPGNDTIDPGLYTVEFSVHNSGDTVAENVGVIISLRDIDTDEETTYTSKVDLLMTNETASVQFKNIPLSPLHRYRIVALVDPDGEWLEVDETNNDLAIDLEIGEAEPEEPIWRRAGWVLGVFVISILISIGLFLYLIRRKL